MQQKRKPKIRTCTYSQLIFNSFSNQVQNWIYIYMFKNEIRSILGTIKWSRWMKYLNLRCKTVNITVENVRQTSQDIALGNDFLDKTLKHSTKTKINKWENTNAKKVLYSKGSNQKGVKTAKRMVENIYNVFIQQRNNIPNTSAT